MAFLRTLCFADRYIVIERGAVTSEFPGRRMSRSRAAASSRGRYAPSACSMTASGSGAARSGRRPVRTLLSGYAGADDANTGTLVDPVPLTPTQQGTIAIWSAQAQVG